MTNQVPFRKQVKDVIQAVAGWAAVVTVIGFIARYNGYDFPAAIVGWGFMIAAASFAIAASIKPKKWRETIVAGGSRNRSEW